MTQAAYPFVPDRTHFYTVRLRDRRDDRLVRHVDILRDVTRLCRKRWPFDIAGAVILPSHLHMIWILPDDDDDVMKRWRMIKNGFARHVPVPVGATDAALPSGNHGIWQRGVWHHEIRDHDDFDRHAHVIRFAPVQAGLVTRLHDWPYGSFRRDLRTTVQAPSSPDQEVVPNSSRSVAIVASGNC